MKALIYITLIVAALVSCSDDTTKNKQKTKFEDPTKVEVHKQYNSKFIAVGKVGRLIVNCEDSLWTKELDVVTDSLFGQYFMPFYPPQQHFQIWRYNNAEFSKLNSKYRNVMHLGVDTSIPKGKPIISTLDSYFADQQLITYVTAHDYADLLKTVTYDLEHIYQQYDKRAWRREYLRNKSAGNTPLAKQMQEKFGIALTLPKQSAIVSSKKNFVRIAFPDESRPMDMKSNGMYVNAKTNFIQYGIMIWNYPFVDSAQLNYDVMLNTRDTVLKYNAPHEIYGVYMGTQDHPLVTPIRNTLTVNTIEGYELTGMFKFTGEEEPSGGVFWSFTFLNPKTNKVVTISSYVDCPPTTSKVPFIRRVQGVLYSIRLDD